MKGQKLAILRSEDVVIVPVHGDLDDLELEGFETSLLRETSKADVNGLILDLSSVDIIDHFMVGKLIRMIRMVALMDVDSVVVGMKPSVAITLTDMNVSWSDIRTALNLEKGLATLKLARK